VSVERAAEACGKNWATDSGGGQRAATLMKVNNSGRQQWRGRTTEQMGNGGGEGNAWMQRGLAVAADGSVQQQRMTDREDSSGGGKFCSSSSGLETS
jgi:hypothetical protein